MLIIAYPRTPISLPLPSFSWTPENAETPPGSISFSRATEAWVLTTTDGTTHWYQTAKSGEIRYEGLRRVENLLDSGTGLGPFSSITKSGRIAVSVVADTGTLTITIDGSDTVFAATGTPQRFVAFADVTGTFSVSISGTATLSEPMAHMCQVGLDLPEPFVGHDITYNANVNGVQYFDNTNGNSVDGGGVVTEALGTTITGGGYLPEPVSTNQMVRSDVNDAAWTKTGLTSTSDGINDAGLAQATLNAGTGTSAHSVTDDAEVGSAGAGYFRVKAGTATFVTVRRGGAVDDYAAFNISTGAVTEEGVGITSSFIIDEGDGWYKIGVVTADTGATLTLAISDTGTPGTASPSFTGASETVLVDHAQYESNNFPTSPIVTSGSTVTRNTDNIVSDLDISATPYSVFADVTAPDVLVNVQYIVVATSTVSLRMTPTLFQNQLGSSASATIVADVSGRHKVAARAADNDFSISVTGEATVTDTSGTAVIPTGGSRGIGESDAIPSLAFRGRIHKVQSYDVGLVDAQLESLVT